MADLDLNIVARNIDHFAENLLHSYFAQKFIEDIVLGIVVDMKERFVRDKEHAEVLQANMYLF